MGSIALAINANLIFSLRQKIFVKKIHLKLKHTKNEAFCE